MRVPIGLVCKCGSCGQEADGIGEACICISCVQQLLSTGVPVITDTNSPPNWYEVDVWEAGPADKAQGFKLLLCPDCALRTRTAIGESMHPNYRNNNHSLN